MMTRIIVAVFLTMLIGCSPDMMVYTDQDPDYDLGTYSTFNFLQKSNIEFGNNPLYHNELMDKRIKDAIKEQLIGKGFTLTQQKPELLIHYHIVVEDKTVIVPEPHPHYYGRYWLHMNMNLHQYREGTLIVDLMDANSNHLVWRGWAVSALEDVYTPDQVEGLVQTAVSNIFRDFPQQVSHTQAYNLLH